VSQPSADKKVGMLFWFTPSCGCLYFFLILAELIPYLKVKKQTKVIELLHEINRAPLSISWDEIIEFQAKCLKGGANGVGIPDLIIAQNAKQNGCMVYSLDKYFRLLNQVLKVKLYV